MAGKRFMVWGLALALLALAVMPAAAQDAGGRICVAAYQDANTNGVREPMEPLLADVVVTLQNDQAISVANYVTTGQAEPHCFGGLAAGMYFVTFSGGMAVATGDSDYAVTLLEGGVPAQVQFGATLSGAPTQMAAAQNTAVAADDTSLLRLVFSLAGAVVVMVAVAVVGLLIFWQRFRKA